MDVWGNDVWGYQHVVLTSGVHVLQELSWVLSQPWTPSAWLQGAILK